MQIKIEDVTVHGPLENLPEGFKESIKPDGSGLLHPITVELVGDDKYKLLAGGKRLRAFKELGLTSIPAVIREGLTEDEAKLVTLDENIKRYNLPWYEVVEKEKEYHEIRVRQFGAKAKGGGARKGVGWSQVDTARELQIAIGTLSEDLGLANALKTYPHLRKVEDKTTAKRLIKQIVKREETAIESLMPSDFEMDQVFLGNSLDILKSLPPNFFHACITDPPWILYRDESLTSDESTLPVFQEVFRVLQRDSLLYSIVSTDDFFLYTKELPKFGFTVQRYPLLWIKSGTITRHGRRQWEYARDYEPILLAAKGNPILTQSTEISAVFSHQAIHSTKLVHPHEKPLSLIKRIIEHCTWEGGKILDPFAGSGSVLKAAKELRRSYIGIEREKKFYDNIVERMK